jgi:hypothetical protein
VRIYDLLLGPPPSQARWNDQLAEAAGRLEAKLTTRRLLDAELGALWTSAAGTQDQVLGNADGPSSPVASLSMVAELLEGRIDTAVSNGVHCGTRSMLVAALSHFPELKSELELLGSGHVDGTIVSGLITAPSDTPRFFSSLFTIHSPL